MFDRVPLKLGTREEFLALREALLASDYTELSVCARLGLGPLQGFRSIRDGRGTALELKDPLDFLIRLFLDGECVSLRLLASMLPGSLLDLLTNLGLLRTLEAEPDSCYAPVALYPTESVYIVSDRFNNPDGSPFKSPPDIVYPAITDSTKEFLGMLPEEPCESFLDLGTGTGIAALYAARRTAVHAWAVDITERAALFTEFNRMLNDAGNVTVLRSDLYEAFETLTFDRIVTHPPYVPAATQELVFRDGGEDGEQITRRIIQGLPRYLRPGGRFYCRALATDREGQPLEQRIRAWLGGAESEFDVLLVGTFSDRLDAAVSSVLSRPESVSGVQQWQAVFEKLGVTSLFLGAIVLQRRDHDRRTFTARRKQKQVGSRELEWLRRWETAGCEEGMDGQILEAKPSVSPNLQLLVQYRMSAGKLAPYEHTLNIESPFPLVCRVEPWTMVLISQADGTRTFSELLEDLKRRGYFGPEAGVEQLMPTLRALISGGFLEIEGFKPPRAEPPTTPVEG